MVYNMLLNSYMRGGRHLKAPDIVKEMKEAGFLPDSFTYCTLIYGFLRVRDHTKALKYHREMMSRGQLPDAKTYAKLRAILKVVEKRRDVNNVKSLNGKPSKPPKKGSEKAKSYWKRDK
jgi:pentatricopeptide repeat protein